ncbi:MAG TPA: transglycosylase family protein [Acidimicrobiales bacterium]|nr:transglycosylase family protein [Acidimicrobiales bacterium]
MTERNPSAIDERTYRRRRLGVLAGVLLVVLGLAPLVDRPDTAPVDVAAGAPDARVHIAGIGSPTAVRALGTETTTTLEAPASSTTAPSTTAAPATTTTTAETEPVTSSRAVEVQVSEDESDDEPAPTTTAAPATTSPPTTAAPRPTTTTTAPPPSTTAPSDGEYAYDDPRSTQVWYDLADCESGGNWSIDTGNGYYGGLQFSLATWESVGGTGSPHEHPAATQIEMGRRLQARQGWGAWPHCSEELGLH